MGFAVVMFVCIMLMPYHFAIELSLVAPRQANAFMQTTSSFLTRHARVLETVTGVVLGLLFFLKGVRALMG